MTEWDAELYREFSGLQQAMAAEVLRELDLRGAKRVLDVGCGDGRITCALARLAADGARVVGVDASSNMARLAAKNASPNLSFGVADARSLPFQHAFDLVVSFNALHWIHEQQLALRSIYSALKAGGRAHLRLVPMGARKSIETVLEETRSSERWAPYYSDFRDPYLRLTSEEFCAVAERCGFGIESVQTQAKMWDFESREKFFAFSSVTTVEWTKRLPEALRREFITDVPDRYRDAAGEDPSEQNVFRFYQMTAVLTAGSAV